jgi:hypothetical protein
MDKFYKAAQAAVGQADMTDGVVAVLSAAGSCDGAWGQVQEAARRVRAYATSYADKVAGGELGASTGSLATAVASAEEMRACAQYRAEALRTLVRVVCGEQGMKRYGAELAK